MKVQSSGTVVEVRRAVVVGVLLADLISYQYERCEEDKLAQPEAR